MNLFTEIGDGDFVPFLNNLGVNTYEKSFEWMLLDPNFSGVLKWLYNNLDHNNALTAHEECRFSELEDKGLLLTPDVLETTLSSIQESYPGLCLPGDQESKEDVELSIKMLSERLNMLEGREKGLIEITEELNTQLQQELTSLNAAHQQCLDDQSTAAKECIALAQELETMMDGVIGVIAKNIEVYANCKNDKQIAKRFIVFNPIEAYRQTQALFQTQFQVFFSENLKMIESVGAERDFKVALSGARALESRFTSSAIEFIESKAQLRGAQAQLALVSNYEHIHPSQVKKRLIEARSALELLQEEETMVEQEMRAVATAVGEQRTQLAVHTVTSAALATRQHINTSLSLLTELWQQAMTLDKLLYSCLRHELRTLEEFLQFAQQLRQYVIGENLAVERRIESMKDIIFELELSEPKQCNNLLLQTLFAIFKSEIKDETVLVKLYTDLRANVEGLKEEVEECYRKKENKLIEIKTSTMPLKRYIYDGCTDKANSRDRTVAALTHTLTARIDAVDRRMLDTGTLFTAVKNGDKHNLRKLWQWFLTDPAKLIAALKTQGSY